MWSILLYSLVKNDVSIERVSDRSGFRRFIRFPAKLYRDDPNWVPPLWSDERRGYDGKHNPILADSEFALFLARRDGEVAGKAVGRILVYEDNAYNRHFNTRTGLFGAFECRDDPHAARALLDAGARWLSDRGMTVMLGPIHPVAEFWGILLGPFDEPPVFLTPHNHPYYDELILGSGFEKAKDLYAYEVNRHDDYEIPERIRRFIDRLRERRPSISVRRFRRNRLIEDAEEIWRLSNEGYTGNWGYVPVGHDVMIDMVKRLKPILDPDAIWFAVDGNMPIGYCLGFPDLNVILHRTRGRLLPTGFITLLRMRRRLTDYRLFGLAVHPDYQGIGIDVLLYERLFAALKPRGIRLEANWILEDNFRMRNALEKLEMTRTRKYRLYRKEFPDTEGQRPTSGAPASPATGASASDNDFTRQFRLRRTSE